MNKKRNLIIAKACIFVFLCVIWGLGFWFVTNENEVNSPKPNFLPQETVDYINRLETIRNSETITQADIIVLTHALVDLSQSFVDKFFTIALASEFYVSRNSELLFSQKNSIEFGILYNLIAAPYKEIERPHLTELEIAKLQMVAAIAAKEMGLQDKPNFKEGIEAAELRRDYFLNKNDNDPM